MKRHLFGWSCALLVAAAVVPGCAENNDTSVIGTQGSVKATTPEGGGARTPADMARQGKESGGKMYSEQGFSGATGAGAPKK
jgi:hypothetical protein